ncbi:MAG TPA: amidohydrolase family protein [Bryobacteraceae bacterium]|jgi:L-fuconolactonase|nr:amidohydrolase family protein [Bryobacteraceae bacterium]
MRIDAHQHFWRYHPSRHSWITEEMSVLKRDFLPEHLLPELLEAKIDRSIAVQAVPSEDETLFLLDLCQAHPEVAGVVGWTALASPEVERRLEFFSRFGPLRGFRHIAQSEPDDFFLVRPDFLRGISKLESFGFTYDILIYPRQLPAALELVTRFPNQRFVIDHMAKPLIRSGEFDRWAAYMRKIAERENTFCKLSGLVTEARWNRWRSSDFTPYLDLIFQAFGTSRLMFGSDWPVCLLAASYRQVHDLIADYACSGQDRIFGENAARFYGLAT